jgi:hypothetical protein
MASVSAAREFFKKLAMVQVSDDLLDVEAAWAGGVADYGDPSAGWVIRRVPGYREYRAKIQQVATSTLGPSFTAWRSAPLVQVEAWINGDVGEIASFTLNKDLALAWHKLAMDKGEDRVVVSLKLTPDHLVMRGRPEESEIVVDTSEGWHADDLLVL